MQVDTRRRAVKISKQELSARKFASALFAEGFTEQQVYAAIATAETESRLQLKTESVMAELLMIE